MILHPKIRREEDLFIQSIPEQRKKGKGGGEVQK